MEPLEEKVFISVRAKGSVYLPYARGVIDCARCGEAILVSPSSEALLEDEQFTPLCVECALALMKEGKI